MKNMNLVKLSSIKHNQKIAKKYKFRQIAKNMIFIKRLEEEKNVNFVKSSQNKIQISVKDCKSFTKSVQIEFSFTKKNTMKDRHGSDQCNGWFQTDSLEVF